MKEKNKFKKIITIVIIVLISICFLTSILVFAEEVDEYKLLVSLPEMEAGEAIKLGPYLENIFKIGIGVAGVLAVIMIIIGGVMYMTVESIEGKSSAKSKINNAILGLVLALSSFLLLNTINTDLTTSSLSLKPVPAPAELPPPVADGRWYGYYKCGAYGSNKLCVGDNYSSCYDNCRPTCPGSPQFITPCSENLIGTDWTGYCQIKAGGVVKTFEGTSEEICTKKLKKACLEIKPLEVQPCREAGGGGDYI